MINKEMLMNVAPYVMMGSGVLIIAITIINALVS